MKEVCEKEIYKLAYRLDSMGHKQEAERLRLIVKKSMGLAFALSLGCFLGIGCKNDRSRLQYNHFAWAFDRNNGSFITTLSDNEYSLQNIVININHPDDVDEGMQDVNLNAVEVSIDIPEGFLTPGKSLYLDMNNYGYSSFETSIEGKLVGFEANPTEELLYREGDPLTFKMYAVRETPYSNAFVFQRGILNEEELIDNYSSYSTGSYGDRVVTIQRN